MFRVRPRISGWIRSRAGVIGRAGRRSADRWILKQSGSRRRRSIAKDSGWGRATAAQFMDDEVVAFFELTEQRGEVKVVEGAALSVGAGQETSTGKRFEITRIERLD